MLDLAALAPGLERRADGIWFARLRGPVSYPDGGNALCLQLEDRSFWFRHRNRCIVSVVRRFSPAGCLLDIGGGNGYVAKGLADAGMPCTVLEPGIDGAVAARARGLEQVICARLEESGLPDSSVAAAGMFDVLEHIEAETEALRQVHAMLRPGGCLFLTVPAYAFLHSADDIAAGHFRRYTRASLTGAVVRAGFRVAYMTYLFAPLPLPVFLLRTVPSLLGLRRGVDEQRQATEHTQGGLAAIIIDRLLEHEARRIAAGGTVPFGTSCLAVAVKD